MSFLQPLLLFGLPLVALPVVIHLINQRRYQTVRWGAMMFLLAANRMSRGYARVRQWLILLARTLAVAGLVFAVSRPLAGGWVGRAAGQKPDTTIVVLDRSPSMQQTGPGAVSKLQAGRQQLARTLGAIGSGRWVLLDGTSPQPLEIESPDALLRLPSAEGVSTSADLPALLEAARDYVRDNRTGRTDVWVCSDLRANDWDPDGGRWAAVRDTLRELPQGVRVHLLAYPEPAAGNVGVRVTGVRRADTVDGAEVLVSLKITREGDGPPALPVQFDLGGTRSELSVELTGPTTELRDHRIPVDKGRERGWGRVSIPADVNPADNDFYFTFDRPPPRRTAVVSAEPGAIGGLQLAASIPADPLVPATAEVVPPGNVAGLEWDALGLVVWHAPLPDGPTADAVRRFVEQGGQVLFLPPATPGDGTFQGVRWKAWADDPNGVAVEQWRGDADVLANTKSGAALPVGQLRVRRWCGLEGELTPLASLPGNKPLLGRLPTTKGGVYFLATTVDPADSSLAANGVVLYAAVQRLLTAGAAALGRTGELVAGQAAGRPVSWKQLAGPPEAVSADYAHHAGAYSDGDRLVAVNRSAAEDQTATVADDRVEALFAGLDFARVDDRAGSAAGLIQEVWRPFLVAMLAALLAEAALCLPKQAARRADGPGERPV